MALEVKNGRLNVCELLCETAVEQTVEGEYVVPDYFPEVETIVKCIASPVVVQSVAAGVRATVEGYIEVSVFYSSGTDGLLHSVSHKLPFSRQQDLSAPAGRFSSVSAGLQQQYFNCRALSPRRLDFRGAYTLYMRVLSEYEKQVVTQVQGDKVRQRTAGAAYMTGEAATEKRFSAEDILPLDESAAGAKVLFAKACAQVEECTQSLGEITVKGLFEVSVQLALADGTLLEKQLELPFHQMTDAALPIADTIFSQAQVCVLSAEARVSSEEPWELTVEVAAVLDAMLYGNVRSEYTQDVFSALFETELVRENLTVVKNIELLQAQGKAERSFELQPDEELVAWGLQPLYCAKPEQTAVAYATVYIVVRTETLQLLCREYTLEFELPALSELSAQQLHTVQLSACRGKLSASRGAVNAQLAVKAQCEVQTLEVVSALTDVFAGAQYSISEKSFALCIYYADAGEHLWDIAKRYNAAPEELAQLNGLEGETVVERTALLIPSV